MKTKTKREMFMVEIDVQRCKGCGYCVHFCPRKVLVLDTRFNDKGYHVARCVDPDRCTGCGICALVCPDMAIGVTARAGDDAND